MTQPIVIFSHGRDSAPWGSKITALAERARAHGYRAESVDYRGIDDPVARVNALLEFARELPPAVLVGSSMGGHVSAAASIELQARGLFLIAPAFYMPGYEQFTPKPAACPISIVHGWHDEVVPVANSIRYAGEYSATLQVVATDHRMLQHIDIVCAYFDLFLKRLN